MAAGKRSGPPEQVDVPNNKRSRRRKALPEDDDDVLTEPDEDLPEFTDAITASENGITATSDTLVALCNPGRPLRGASVTPPNHQPAPVLLPPVTIVGEYANVPDIPNTSTNEVPNTNLVGEEELATQGRESYCDEALIIRIKAIGQYTNPGLGIYAVQRIPKDATWGTASPFKNTAGVLCHKGTTNPVTLWIIGEITETFFFDRDNDPTPRAGVTILPLSPDIRRVCAEQIRNFCEPKIAANGPDKWGPGLVKASKWMNVKPRRNEPAPGPRMFDAIYDATERLRDKQSMDTVSPEGLAPHDLVLLEVGISRYRVAQDNEPTLVPAKPRHPGSRKPMIANSGGWTRWVAYYDMKAICVLQTAPDDLLDGDDVKPTGTGLDL